MKKPITILTTALLCLALAFVTNQTNAQTTIISYGSTWKYLDNNTRPANWETSGFNDVSWSSGPSELGYGDAPATTVNYGPDANNKYITTYFRQAVTIANPAAYTNFTLNVRRDDGVVVYINGVERYANNMPAGRTHTTLASANAADDGATPQTTTLSSAFFSAGTNVIAVEIHQNAANSSDLTFDLELLGNAPGMSLISYGDSWKYLDNNTRPANWNTSGFSDITWATGNSEFGYGDGGEATCVASGGGGTLCTPTGNKYITTYFRKNFTITGLNTLNSISLNIIRDDGFVVYVNGVEVARDNMPGGTPTHSTLAAAAIGGADETTPESFSLSTCAFVEGANTIAVEMHQNDITSSDLSFNLELNGVVGGGTPTLNRGPYLQSGTQTSITIRWKTSNACLGRVRVGPANGTYTTATVDETCPTTDHIITVSGLTADTKYFYEISSTTGTVFQSGVSNFFRTNPLANTTRKIRITAFGDCGRGNATYQDNNLSNYLNYLTTNSIDAPDAWILLGDNAYSTGTDLEYTNNFFNIYGSNILKNHKMYPAPGNHDYGNSSGNKTSRSMPYHTNFTVPMAGEAGGVASNKQNYYSYDIGNIHFLSLDSYGIESDGTNMETAGSSALKTWLTADLAANTKKWVIAYWHHAPYTKSSHNSDSESDLVAIRQNFIDFLENRGVDLIICGHSHAYERGYLIKNYNGNWSSFNSSTHAVSTSNARYDGASNCPYVYNTTPADHGTVYVVAGSTGASGGTNAGFASGPMPFAVNDAGIFYFEVEDNRLDAKMLRQNGTVFDQFTIMKDVNQTPTINSTNGSTVNLTASWPQSGNYTWTPGALGTSRNASVVPPNNATTVYTVRDAFSCIQDQITVTTSGTLPVTIRDYNARLVNGKVEVIWVTETEIDSRYFIIERSANGRDFSQVGQLNAAGNSSSLIPYSFTDNAPLAGVSYYRLVQVDIDGKTEYYGVKRIMNSEVKDFDVKVLSGNPGRLVLQISSQLQANYNINIVDMSGRIVKSDAVNIVAGSLRKEFYLATGTYMWEVRNTKGDAILQKVVVQ
jgi:hypothetical protein